MKPFSIPILTVLTISSVRQSCHVIRGEASFPIPTHRRGRHTLRKLSIKIRHTSVQHRSSRSYSLSRTRKYSLQGFDCILSADTNQYRHFCEEMQERALDISSEQICIQGESDWKRRWTIQGSCELGVAHFGGPEIASAAARGGRYRRIFGR